MWVYGHDIPDDKGLTNLDLIEYVRKLGIEHFRGVFMRDTLPQQSSHHQECGIMNLNTSQQPGSHWTCYFRDGKNVYTLIRLDREHPWKFKNTSRLKKNLKWEKQ